MDDLPESMARSPELFPHALDVVNDTVTFIRLSRDDYDAASFLDGRVVTPLTIIQTMPWRQVAAAVEAAALPERCDFIFHIGHVGSTLLSRLIGAHARVFALREPAVLRALAHLSDMPEAAPRWTPGEIDARLGTYLRLWSRTFDSRQTAVLKATSFVSELAARLLSRASAPRAVMMFVSPESYLATIFGGANSRREARTLTPLRLRRLHRRIGREAWRLDSLSEGETVALGWACEMSALAHAARQAGERILRVDFERFLAHPPATLLAVLRHLAIDAGVEEVDAILGGPDMQRYSKAPEYAYDAALRRDVLDEARALHGAEILRGLRWLEHAAAEFTPIGDALQVADGRGS